MKEKTECSLVEYTLSTFHVLTCIKKLSVVYVSFVKSLNVHGKRVHDKNEIKINATICSKNN